MANTRGVLDMAKRMANACDLVRKKISKTFLQKKFQNIFKTEKKFYRNSGIAKIFFEQFGLHPFLKNDTQTITRLWPGAGSLRQIPKLRGWAREGWFQEQSFRFSPDTFPQNCLPAKRRSSLVENGASFHRGRQVFTSPFHRLAGLQPSSTSTRTRELSRNLPRTCRSYRCCASWDTDWLMFSSSALSRKTTNMHIPYNPADT